MPTYDDEDKAELLPGGGGDVDHGEDQVEEGDGGEEETLEEDREGAGETPSSGVYYFIFTFQSLSSHSFPVPLKSFLVWLDWNKFRLVHYN